MRQLLPLLLLSLFACGGSADPDADGDGFPASEDCDDRDERVNPGAVERCGGGDEDCDGLVDAEDDDLADGRPAWLDTDEDGYGDAQAPTTVCTFGDGLASNADDCDDTNADINPAAVETCGGGDQDCDGLFDTDDPSLVDGVVVYDDADGDGFGPAGGGTLVCDAPSDSVLTGGDCDDADPARSPGALEVCNDIDDDCDGLIDLDDPDGITGATWYRDGDGDGAGDPAFPVVTCGPFDGLVLNGDDCNDARADVAPGADEICDRRDNDCNGLVDGDDPGLDDGLPFYADEDGDGYGSADDIVVTCERPPGYVDNDLDCADDQRLVNPGRDEICDDGIDNDCDGAVGSDCLGLTGREVIDDLLAGTDGGSQSGASLFAFDDGDGLGDIAVGSPAYEGAGRASLLLGPLLDRADLTPEVAVDGEEGTALGVATAWSADLDGDGAPDWIVSAPEAGEAGQVYLFSDPLSSSPTSPADATVVLDGPDPESLAGFSLATLTVDAEGTPGLLVGVPLAEAPSVNGGEAYVLASPVTSGALADVAIGVLRGVNLDHEAGTSVAAGDLDGDGVDDVVIGAPYVALGKGTAYVVAGPVPADLPLNAGEGVWSGLVVGDAAGTSVAVPGDVDGDGRHDLLVGAPGSSRGADGGGTAYVIVGDVMAGITNLNGADAILDGAQAGEAAGSSLGAVDTTGDGILTLLVGAPERDDVGDGDGAVYVVSSSVRGVMTLDAADGTLVPGSSTSSLGSAISPLDLDGDGLGDIAIGASRDDSGGFNSGAVYLWRSLGGGL